MGLLRITSPHAHGPLSTSRVMQYVLLATVPGVIALTHFFGFGTLINIAWACVVALGCESLALVLRRRPLGFYLKDCSALVTATGFFEPMVADGTTWISSAGNVPA